MSTDVRRRPLQRRLRLRPAWSLPSWMLSFLFHGSLVALLLFGPNSWRRGPVGFGDGGSQQIGFVLEGSAGTGPDPESTPGGGSGKGETGHVTDTVLDAGAPSEIATTETPIALPSSVEGILPTSLNNASGATPMVPPAGIGIASASTDARDFVRGATGRGNGRGTGTGSDDGSGSGGGGTGAGGGIPGAAFMGTRDRGSRVVFVIDCSASMANDNAMRTAKAALVSSLQSLSEAQQFQIIFYNQTPTLLKLRNAASGELAFATEVNKTFARQYIAGIEADLGTDHMPALRMALRLNPDVIFFLTDADEPQLSTGELNDIKRLNQGRARIHTIEFGRGAELGDDINFLMKLATQNGGTYRYHDVRRMAMDR